ncbi:MAG: AsnC family transcriptional regulator, partial [Candidatus Thermoplasmatota archaeon]|nr:AsnC family transcriptional regulator [Candidatus Thermoplasmatota archaeon]
MELDSLDIHILARIQGNARVSFSDIACETGVSESTVFARAKKLEENGIILGYKARLDRQRMGAPTTAIMGFEINGKDISEVCGRLKSIDAIKYLYVTHGIYNAIALIHAKGLNHLHVLANEKIAKIDGILSMQVLVVLDVVKEDLSVDLDRLGDARGIAKMPAKAAEIQLAAKEAGNYKNAPERIEAQLPHKENPVLDNVDLHILRMLQKDARVSFKELAKNIMVSEGTAYVRMKKLVENGFIERFYTDLNPKMLDEDVGALIGIRINRKNLDLEALMKKAKDARIKAVYLVSGIFDVVMLVKARSL